MRTEMVTTALDTAIADLRPKMGNSLSTPTAARNTPRTPSATSVSPPASSPRSDALDPVSTMPQAEALNATIKKELIHPRRWHDLDQVRAALFEYIEIDYNRDRIHQALGYLTPTEYETKLEFTEAA